MKHYLSAWNTRLLLFALFAFGLSGHLQAQIINTIAGNGAPGYNGEGSPAIAKELYNPFGVAVDAYGNIYIADQNNNRIRKVTPSGIISTFAGTGTMGFSGSGIPATASDLYTPMGVAVDGSGNVYIADQGDSKILKVDASGIITTVAGNGTFAYTGDGSAATNAGLQFPTSVAFDATGNMYIADYGNNVIRKVNTSGIISTFAGNGVPTWSGDSGPAISASLWNPEGVAVAGNGDMYIADWGNSRIRKVTATSGFITTFVIANHPSSIVIDANSNLLVSEQGTSLIRKINPLGGITTIAGTTIGYGGDGGAATSAQLNNPTGIALDGSGSLYIGDMNNNRVRKISNITVPLSPITGVTNLCIGVISSFSDATAGGSWSSTNPSVATIGASTGIVTAVAAGVTTIIYTTGSSSVMTNLTVSNAPYMGKILGLNNTCPGVPVILYENVSGGSWSSSDPTISTVNGSGVVTGVSPGIDTIYYTVISACGGTGTLRYVFTVLPCLTGVSSVNSSIGENVINAWPNPNDGTFTIKLTSNNEEEAHIVITNVVGEKVKEYTTDTNKPLDIKMNASNGLYFINAVTAHGSWSEKVIVSH